MSELRQTKWNCHECNARWKRNAHALPVLSDEPITAEEAAGKAARLFVAFDHVFGVNRMSFDRINGQCQHIAVQTPDGERRFVVKAVVEITYQVQEKRD